MIEYTHRPDEIWALDRESSEATRRALGEFNTLGYEGVMERLPSVRVDRATKIEYALINPEGSSTNEIAVMMLPFGNPVTEDKLLRGEFVRLSAEFEGVRDKDGKPLPMLLLGSAGWGASLRLSFEEKRRVASGDFAPVASKYLEIIRSVELGKFATGKAKEPGKVGLMAHSQGTEVGIDVLSEAGSDLDIIGFSFGDPTTTQEVNPLVKAQQFAAGGKQLKEAVESAGVEPFEVSQGFSNESSSLKPYFNMIKAVLATFKPVNLALGIGLSRGTLDTRLSRAFKAQPNVQGTIATGESSITNTEELLAIVDDHRQVESLLLEGENHTWGNKATRLAEVLIRAVQ